MDDVEDAVALEQLYRRLPPDQRRIGEEIVLPHFRGMTFAEIGKLRGVSRQTAWHRYRSFVVAMQRATEPDRRCLHCGGLLDSARPNRRYCKVACRVAAHRERARG